MKDPRLVPACAGVILSPQNWMRIVLPCPRVCGGDPHGLSADRRMARLSPRVRG